MRRRERRVIHDDPIQLSPSHLLALRHYRVARRRAAGFAFAGRGGRRRRTARAEAQQLFSISLRSSHFLPLLSGLSGSQSVKA